MTLSCSRDPFCCFTTSQDLQMFFDCRRRALSAPDGHPERAARDHTALKPLPPIRDDRRFR